MCVPAGERWDGGVSTVAQREEPLLLQAADESRPLSIFLSGLLAHNTHACSHVPHWCPVARSHWEVTQIGSRFGFFLASTAF